MIEAIKIQYLGAIGVAPRDRRGWRAGSVNERLERVFDKLSLLEVGSVLTPHGAACHDAV
jgi:hypothetical protein